MFSLSSFIVSIFSFGLSVVSISPEKALHRGVLKMVNSQMMISVKTLVMRNIKIQKP